jgi:amidase
LQVLRRADATAYELIENPPRLRVEPGERFCVEVEDCFGGALSREDQLPVPTTFGERWDREEWNPCAGPIFIEGARPGDTLVVTIHDITVGPKGVTAIFPGVGPLADSATYADCRGPYTQILEHRPGPAGSTSDGVAARGGRELWPLNPHIGTIGTAAALPMVAGANSNFGQGPFGGNIDCRHVAKGSKVLLPVSVQGACLYLGDVHASMADGELFGTADEAEADITVSCEIVPGRRTPWVRLETGDALIQLNSSRPLEDAIQRAFRWMLDWLVEDYGFEAREAYIHLGVNSGVEIRVYQMVELGRLNYTVGVVFPKSSLELAGAIGRSDG